MKLLTAFDESQSPRCVCWKESITGSATRRLGQKPFPFVEAYGFQIDADFLSESANREWLCFGSCCHKTSLNPVVGYGVKLTLTMPAFHDHRNFHFVIPEATKGGV
jgi:hypothetical protein